MDPNQNPQPSSQPTPPIGSPPQPEVPSIPEPAVIQSVAPLPPVEPTVIQPVSPQPSTPPNSSGPAPVVPASYNTQNLTSGGGSRKKLIIIAAGIVGLLVVLALAFLLFKILGTKAEIKVGSQYIIAVQNKDYKMLDEAIDPDIKNIADKAKSSGQAKSKDEFYKSFLESSGFGTIAGKDKPKNKSLKVSEGGGKKHASVVYEVGSKSVTALEIYDSKNKPHVIGITDGDKVMSDSEFKSNYESYKSVIDYFNSALSGSNQ